MGISRYVQILWFEKNNQVFSYSLSYAAMAIAGSLSFLIGSKINGMKLIKSFALFVPLYSLGMILRIFPTPFFLPIISGFISGIGASTVILIIKTWIFELINKNDEDKEFLISSRVMVGQIGSVISVLIAGQLLVLFKESEYIYILLLIISSIGIFTVFFIKIPDKSMDEKHQKLLPSNKKLAFFAFFSTIIVGMSNGMLEPYFPIILKNVGFSLYSVSIIMSIYALTKILSGIVFQNKKLSKNPNYTVLTTRWLLAILSVIIILLNYNQYITLLLILVMGILFTGSAIAIELWEYKVFPANELPIYFGVIQSSFFIGDAIGGAIGGFFYSYLDIKMLFIGFSILSIILGAMYFGMYKIKLNNKYS